MMKRIAAVAIGFCFLGSATFAGTVNFTPDNIVIDRSAGDAEVFNVGLAIGTSTFASFDAFNILVGTDAGDILSVPLELDGDGVLVPALDLIFDSTLPRIGFEGVIENFGVGGFADNIRFGWSNPFGAISGGQLVGTFIVDVTSLANGEYTIIVDSERDEGASTFGFGSNDPDLVELATLSISIVPEPATLALLGIGGLVTAFRRRRTA